MSGSIRKVPVMICTLMVLTGPTAVAGIATIFDGLNSFQLTQIEGLDREDLRKMQIALKALGYDPGPADGVLGARSRAAVRAFQSAEGMLPTGELSEELIARLNTRILASAAARRALDQDAKARGCKPIEGGAGLMACPAPGEMILGPGGMLSPGW